MAAPAESDTKNRILDAAEGLFHKRGFQGSSLRAVTAAAGVNVAAVNYHFGSKVALLRAVVERRSAPVNAERLAALERVLAEAGGEPPSVEAIAEAFLGPVMKASHAVEIRDVSALLFREPVELVVPLMAQIFQEMAERFTAALALALPDLQDDEVTQRFHLMLSLMVQVASGRHEMGIRELFPQASVPSPQATYEAVVAFVAAGLRAPGTRESA